ncbi:MAG: glycosyltransferase family 4 protein [Lachnospiraceae bacterium]|nr:glycosyltransferase family 4 protein [Lachnospiraceae bacterium]
MKRILIVTNFDVGLYNFRKEVLEALLAVPYEIHIALPNGEFVPRMQEMGCIFHETALNRRGTNPFQELQLIRRYRQILKEVKPDVVLTYTIKPNLYAGSLCRLMKIPYITNITGLGTAVEGDGLLQHMTTAIYRFAMKRVSCLFFQNRSNEQYFVKRKIGPGKHVMLPGSGVNLERYRFLEYPKGEKSEFLFISRVMKEKGIEEYLEMAQVIKAKYPQTEFHILGFCEEDYENRDRLMQLHEQGIVQFHGMIEDIHPFLARSQCTIHPSFYPEGMSNVCLESQASGRPVITTKRPGCADTIEDGVTGFLIKAQDAGDLTARVEQFLKLSVEERAEMGRRARERMEQKFDRKIVVAKYLEEIAEVVGR